MCYSKEGVVVPDFYFSSDQIVNHYFMSSIRLPLISNLLSYIQHLDKGR
jgi:hypothetical protein